MDRSNGWLGGALKAAGATAIVAALAALMVPPTDLKRDPGPNWRDEAGLKGSPGAAVAADAPPAATTGYDAGGAASSSAPVGRGGLDARPPDWLPDPPPPSDDPERSFRRGYRWATARGLRDPDACAAWTDADVYDGCVSYVRQASYRDDAMERPAEDEGP